MYSCVEYGKYKLYLKRLEVGMIVLEFQIPDVSHIPIAFSTTPL